MSDTHAEARALFQKLWPLTRIEDGQQFAVVLGLLPPSTDYQNALKWRALVEEYRLEHVQGCDCPLCARYAELVGKKAGPLPLPLEVSA